MPSKATRTATGPRPLSAAKRKSLATQQLLNNLGGDDQAAAVTAALEVINEWLPWDTALHERLHQKYEELRSIGGSKKKEQPGPVPVPISGRSLDSFNPYGKLDPYRLLDEYGREHLRAVLMRATQRLLREAVDIVQSHEPATKPASRSRNDAMIDYIVENVAGPGF